MALQFIVKKFRKRPNYKIVPSSINGKVLGSVETVTDNSDVNSKKDKDNKTSKASNSKRFSVNRT